MRRTPPQAAHVPSRQAKVAVYARDAQRRSEHCNSLKEAGFVPVGFSSMERLVIDCRTRKQGYDVLVLEAPADLPSVAVCLASIKIDRLRLMPLLLMVEERELDAVHGITRAAPIDFILAPFGASELRSRVRQLAHWKILPVPKKRRARALSSQAGP